MQNFSPLHLTKSVSVAEQITLPLVLFPFLSFSAFRACHSRSSASSSVTPSLCMSSFTKSMDLLWDIYFLSSCLEAPYSMSFTQYIKNASSAHPQNHLSLTSLTLSPKYSTWAVFPMCSFLILSILVTPNKASLKKTLMISNDFINFIWKYYPHTSSFVLYPKNWSKINCGYRGEKYKAKLFQHKEEPHIKQ